MKELGLQPRLQLLSELIPEGAKLADIGTDHGYLPVALFQRGKIQSAIASDIGEEPLQHARRTAEEYEISDIDFRLCDGLSGISPEEADTIVIAGMGGETIISILSAAPWTKENHLLLLQPMTKIELLRRWLGENGYTFEKERLVWDKGILYPVFVVRGGEKVRPLSVVEQYAGITLDGDPLYGDYLDNQMSRLQKAIDGLNKANDCCSHGRACEFDAIRKTLEEKKKSL